MTSIAQLTPLRYSASTVTLEVMAREAVVSQWSDQPVVEVWRYRLQIQTLSESAAAIEIQGDRASFLPLMTAVQDYVQRQLTGEAGGEVQATQGPYLVGDGLTQYTLHLGNTRTSTGAASVRLGAVQLADLEDVFDQLHQAVRPLPFPLVSAQQRRPWRQWGTAAAGLVAAVGVTTALLPNYLSQQRLETAQEAPTADIDGSLGPEQPSAGPRAITPDAIAEADTTDESANLTIPNQTAQPEEQSAVERVEPSPERGSKTEAVAPGPSSTPQLRQTPPVADDTVPPPISDPITGDVAPGTATAPASTVPTPNTTSAPVTANTPPLPPPSPPAVAAGAASTETEPAETTDALSESLSSPEAQRVAPRLEPRSLADLVQQVRDRWLPPIELDQTVIYTLVFAADGTLIEVIPADAVALEYRDRTGIPTAGTVRLATGESRRIRLLLKPDGDVELPDAGGSSSEP